VQNVEHFCKLKGVKPTVACTESGAGRNFMTDIKKGQVPAVSRVQLLAKYLDVTTSQLLGEPEYNISKDSPIIISDAEAALNEELISRLCRLTPEELARVDAFVQGMIASR
jgi:transcriptional regulator with XRE-family HTH domain